MNLNVLNLYNGTNDFFFQVSEKYCDIPRTFPSKLLLSVTSDPMIAQKFTLRRACTSVCKRSRVNGRVRDSVRLNSLNRQLNELHGIHFCSGI